MFIKNALCRAGVAVICGVLMCTVAMGQQQKQQTKKQQTKKLEASQQKQQTGKKIAELPAIQQGSITDRIPPFKPSVRGIDPAVIYFKAVMKRKIDAHTAEVSLRGVVQNIGTDDFLSRKNQQSVRLVSTTPGASGEQVVKSTGFVNLKSGKKVIVEHTLAWSASQEFPKDYQFRIDYDPDIRLDSNPNNDDVRSKDNRKRLTGAAITKQVKNYLLGVPAKGKTALNGIGNGKEKGIIIDDKVDPSQKTMTSRKKQAAKKKSKGSDK